VLDHHFENTSRGGSRTAREDHQDLASMGVRRCGQTFRWRGRIDHRLPAIGTGRSLFGFGNRFAANICHYAIVGVGSATPFPPASSDHHPHDTTDQAGQADKDHGHDRRFHPESKTRWLHRFALLPPSRLDRGDSGFFNCRDRGRLSLEASPALWTLDGGRRGVGPSHATLTLRTRGG